MGHVQLIFHGVSLKNLILVLFCTVLFVFPAKGHVVRVACVGNSITYGSGIANRERMSYPAQLQGWLGKDYEVRNFGVSGATLLMNGDLPYRNCPEFNQSLEWEPDIVIIKLGTNDSKPFNWKYGDEFEKDYADLIAKYRELKSKPRILAALPVPVFVAEKWGIRDSVVREEIIPKIKTVAAREKIQVIDLYNALLPHPGAFPDAVHPNSIGAGLMVEEIYRGLFHRDQQHSSGYLNTAILAAPGSECRGAAAGWGEGKDWYSQFEAISQIGQARPVELVFLGNSITQGIGGEGRTVYTVAPGLWDSIFGGWEYANFGISGDRTQHVIWRILNGNFDHVKPKVVVLEIGVNNFPVHDAGQITAGISAILKALKIKAPGAKVLLVGPLPAGKDSSDPLRVKYKQVHQQIKSLGSSSSVHYLNFDRHFIQPDGSLFPGLLAGDGIHLTHQGYKAWGLAMEKEIRNLFKK
jgi:lysophospholipase L1-like esterase